MIRHWERLSHTLVFASLVLFCSVIVAPVQIRGQEFPSGPIEPYPLVAPVEPEPIPLPPEIIDPGQAVPLISAPVNGGFMDGSIPLDSQYPVMQPLGPQQYFPGQVPILPAPVDGVPFDGSPLPLDQFAPPVGLPLPLPGPPLESYGGQQYMPSPLIENQSQPLAMTLNSSPQPECRYWIVSSRCGAQHPADCGWSVQVYQRCGNGQTVPSSLQELSANLQPGVPTCIVSHGSFVTWEDTCNESAAAHQWIRAACPHLPLNVIFFTWPSETSSDLLIPFQAASRGLQADHNGFYVAHLISHIPESSPVTLMGHSHGCRVILSALHLAGGGAIDGLTYSGNMGMSRRYRAVFAAAAVDHNWLNPGRRYDRALLRAECLLNLKNPKDIALFWYPLLRPFARQALARTGFTRIDRNRQGDLNNKIKEVNVQGIVGHGHVWPFYFQSPQIAAIIAPYIYYPDMQTAPAYSPAYEPTPAPAVMDQQPQYPPPQYPQSQYQQPQHQQPQPPIGTSNHSPANQGENNPQWRPAGGQGGYGGQRNQGTSRQPKNGLWREALNKVKSLAS